MSPPSSLQDLLAAGVQDGTYPAAQACVIHRGRVLFESAAGAASTTTVFDLASLTKVVTTALFVALRGQDILGPNAPIGALLPTVAAPDRTFEDLLFHRAGLPAWRPFFAAPQALPAILAAGKTPEAFARSREVVLAAALATPADRPAGALAVYSDVGFILLGEALGLAAGRPLERAYAERVQGPLQLSLHYRPLGRPIPAVPTEDLAPTGITRPRPPAPGQEGLFQVPTVAPEINAGEVDDDNAWAMGGVSGHAGLFGTAAGVAQLGQRLLEERGGAGRLASAGLWSQAFTRDPKTPGSERTLGFDTVTPGASSGGRFMSPQAVGHLGFTGTSLWIDPARDLVVALVSNRTLPGRDNGRIRSFRPRFHDAVAALL